jgi:hypothetical protein
MLLLSISSFRNCEKCCWKIAIWSKTTPPRRLTNDLILPLQVLPKAGETVGEDQICLFKEGVIPKPIYALCLEDSLFSGAEVQDRIQLVDFIVEIVHRYGKVIASISRFLCNLLVQGVRCRLISVARILCSRHKL